jgi:hypothetical protein
MTPRLIMDFYAGVNGTIDGAIYEIVRRITIEIFVTDLAEN